MKDIRTIAAYFGDQMWRRRWTALLVTWAVCAGGWFVVAMMPDKYVSEARFQVDTTSLLTPLLKGISVNSDDQSRDREVTVMQRTLTSRPNLLKVAQMTDLDKTTHSDGALQDLLTSLEARISIRSQDNNLFLVQFTDSSAVMAQNVVQALLTIFVESSVGDKREDIKTARTFIDGQIEEYEGQLKKAEQRVAAFKIENIEYLSATSQTFAMRMDAAQENLKAAKFDYEDAASQSVQLSRQLRATPQYLSLNSAPQIVIGGAGTGGSLQQRIIAMHTRLDDLLLQFTDKHPDVMSAQQSLNRLLEQKKLEDAAQAAGKPDPEGIRTQIPNDLYNQLSLRLAEADGRVTTARRKLAEVEGLFEGLRARASEAPKIEAEFTNLTRDYEVFRSSYDGLLQRRESARIAAAADSTAEPIQFRMVAAPELPARPIGPNRTLFNTAVLIVGLLAGGGFVVLLTQVDQRVVVVEDLESFSDVRVLGSVSDITLRPRTFSREAWLNRFGITAGALAAVFAILIVIHPNLSKLLKAVL